MPHHRHLAARISLSLLVLWLAACDAASAQNSLSQRIRAAAARDGVASAAIDTFIRALSERVDLHEPAVPGDTLALLRPAGSGELSFAELNAGGETTRYYGFKPPDGDFDYYDAAGKSAERAMRRKPLSAAGVLDRSFGWRSDPIRGGGAMHTGVDWLAPPGTPIEATADGTVERVERDGSRAGFLSLRHLGGYESTYSYLSIISVDIPGTRVTKGDVIGTIGRNGASGPVIHYEMLVNGRFVDPMRVRLPSKHALEGPALVDFERQRDRLDALAAGASRHDLYAPR